MDDNDDTSSLTRFLSKAQLSGDSTDWDVVVNTVMSAIVASERDAFETNVVA